MTIKEVAEKVKLSQDTLRYYEKQGLIGPINKTSGGIRDYNENDLRRIKFIKCMRNAELPINILKKYVELFDKGDSTKDERKKLLLNQRDVLKQKIDNMNMAYELLNYKIELFYNGKIDEYFEKTRDKDDI